MKGLIKCLSLLWATIAVAAWATIAVAAFAFQCTDGMILSIGGAIVTAIWGTYD